MAMPVGYKPSPLGYGSPRSSPFRQPTSPTSTIPQPQTTPTKNSPSMATPSRFIHTTPTPSTASWTPRNGNAFAAGAPQLQPAPEMGARSSGPPPAPGAALAQLLPAQLRTLREGFQILDRDSDGSVGRDDVADMLNQLGLPSTPADVAQFFPPAAAQTMPMGIFLNTIAAALATLSPSAELLSALSAFDEDDSGQVDLAELRDALLHTAPEPGEPPLTESEIYRVVQGFTSRRAFTAQSRPGAGSFAKRGEVFRYNDFVQSITGSGQDSTEDAEEE